jgi:hypothetical protein
VKGAWIIRRDYISRKEEECYHAGLASHDWKPEYAKRPDVLKWRAYDDDGELYYTGLLIDDDQCEGQMRVLEFTMNDAGCVRVEVFRDGKWIVEVG